MAELAPPASGSLPALSGFTHLAIGQKIKAFTAQPALRRSLPALIGVSGIAVAGVLWLALTGPDQRILYNSLSDNERADVVASLDGAGIPYTIDNQTGALNVSEEDLYKARMTVASDGALAPDAGADLLDTIPLGSSRMLEAERLRMARERELMLTILEIDGVEGARVHLAVPERSSFVGPQTVPSASVMVRLGRGSVLTPEQVNAVISLVAAAVPGMSQNAVRLTNQHGQMLTGSAGAADDIAAQNALEDKLKLQVTKLLLPILGDGNFAAEVQVQLSSTEITRAEEAFDRNGVLKKENQTQSQQLGVGPSVGVPGVLSNAPPQNSESMPSSYDTTSSPPLDKENTIQRNYEVGRQVSVSSEKAGALNRLSIAIAVDEGALKRAKPISIAQIKSMVSAAVGVQTNRGDDIVAVVSSFHKDESAVLPFYELPIFITLIHYMMYLAIILCVLIYTFRNKSFFMDKKSPSSIQHGEQNDYKQSMQPLSKYEEYCQNQIQDTNVNDKAQLVNQLAVQQPDKVVTSLRRLLKASEKV